MVNMRPFAVKVHRSLLNRDLIAGIPQVGLLGLIILSVFSLYILQLYFMVFVIVILYLVMRFLTAKDPWLIDIMLNSVQHKDKYLP